MAKFACGSAPIWTHPSQGSWPHRELRRKTQWHSPHGVRGPNSAHPSHVSWPHRELHRRPQRLRPHASPPPISAHPPHTFRGLIGSSTERPNAKFAWRRRLILAHPSHVSRPHGELHRRPQWQSLHGDATSFWHTPHSARGPMGSSTEGPSGRARMVYPPHFGTPLTRFVAP